MGRRLSHTLVGAERIADYNAKIIAFAEQVMKLDTSTPPSIEPLKSAYESAKRVKPAPSLDTIQRVLMQSYIIGEGYKNE